MTGIDDEVRFWEQWIDSRGGEWPDDFRQRLDPEAEVEDYLPVSVGGEVLPRLRILDVGSGPLTKLGKHYRGQALDLSACDPLADVYSALLKRAGIAPLVPVRMAFAEDLSAFFAPDSFDLVHCINALDHSFDPLRAIHEMLRVARVGGTVVLMHQPNEAEAENYVGLHQWNFDVQDGRFVVWNRERRIDVADAVRAVARVEADGSGYIRAVLRKHAPLDELAGEGRAERLAQVMRALMQIVYGQSPRARALGLGLAGPAPIDLADEVAAATAKAAAEAQAARERAAQLESELADLRASWPWRLNRLLRGGRREAS
jgi:SAM-dependent methyltransferase